MSAYGVQKDGPDEPIFGAAMEMQTQRKNKRAFVDTAGEGSGMNSESIMETGVVKKGSSK